jgi:hypothetical protein
VNELRAERDSLPRSERGVRGTRRSVPRIDDEAGVAQLVELQPSKLDVAGSNPVARSICQGGRHAVGGVKASARKSSYAHVAQSVERVLGKDEVISSILIVGSRHGGGKGGARGAGRP